jgi:hypothetical protein
MPSTVQLSKDGRYVIQTITGDITPALSIEYNRAAHVFAKQHGVNRFLSDLTKSQNVASVIENYDFAYQEMPQDPDIDPLARVALLVRPDDHTHDFVVTAMRNSGLIISLFNKRKEAVEYLLK